MSSREGYSYIVVGGGWCHGTSRQRNCYPLGNVQRRVRQPFLEWTTWGASNSMHYFQGVNKAAIKWKQWSIDHPFPNFKKTHSHGILTTNTIGFGGKILSKFALKYSRCSRFSKQQGVLCKLPWRPLKYYCYRDKFVSTTVDFLECRDQ